jgi:hypothetical protein
MWRIVSTAPLPTSQSSCRRVELIMSPLPGAARKADVIPSWSRRRTCESRCGDHSLVEDGSDSSTAGKPKLLPSSRANHAPPSRCCPEGGWISLLESSSHVRVTLRRSLACGGCFRQLHWHCRRVQASSCRRVELVMPPFPAPPGRRRHFPPGVVVARASHAAAITPFWRMFPTAPLPASPSSCCRVELVMPPFPAPPGRRM